MRFFIHAIFFIDLIHRESQKLNRKYYPGIIIIQLYGFIIQENLPDIASF